MTYTNFNLFKVRAFSLTAAALLMCGSLAADDGAQKAPSTVAKGYISAVQSATKFDVDGIHVTTSAATHYGLIPKYQLIGKPDVSGAEPSPDAVRVGMWVEITGSRDKRTKSATAESVLFRDDWDNKIKGFGVIDRVIAAGPEPLYQVDGYRMRVVSGATSTFSGGMKSLTDVGTNVWVGYEGKVDKAGVLVVSKAAFVPARTRKAVGYPLSAAQEPAPSQESLIDATGRFESVHTKVRLSNAGGMCGWHRVPANKALQERVRRVGERVIPEYLKQFALDDPARINFRFYAVDEAKIRSELVCVEGLVLVPRQVVERLKNDDQLAAVLADGVAYNMQMQSAKVAKQSAALLGGQIAGGIVGAFVPGVSIATVVGVDVIGVGIEMRLEEQRERIALTLMADAGYDPWQAPEAWRLLAPKSAEKDPGSLKYPNRSWYQLGILNLQYGKVLD